MAQEARHVVHHHRPFGHRLQDQVGVMLGGDPGLQAFVRLRLQGLDPLSNYRQMFAAFRAGQAMRASQDLAVALGELAPVLVRRGGRWRHLDQAIDAFEHQSLQRRRVLDDPGLDPARHPRRDAVRRQRMQAAVEEHGVDQHLHIGVVERDLDLGAVVWRWRFARARAIQSKCLQVAIPRILHHAQQRALGRQPCGDGLVGEQPLALNDACRVLSKQGWQRAVGKVKPQQLTPEVHRVANRPRRQLVDVFEDEVLRLVLAACILQFRLVGMKQPGKMLRLDLLHCVVSQLGEQIGKAEAHHTTVMHDVPRQRICVGAAKMQHQRWR